MEEESEEVFFPGPFAKALNLDFKTIYNNKTQLNLPENQITNGLIEELFLNCCRSQKDIIIYLQRLNSNLFSSCTVKSLQNKCVSNHKKLQKLSKNKDKDLNTFKSSAFIPPSNLPCPNTENETVLLKRKLQEEEDENTRNRELLEEYEKKEKVAINVLQSITNKYEDVQKQFRKDYKQLEKEANEWEIKYKKEESRLTLLIEKHEQLKTKTNTRNINKKLKRRDLAIEKKEEEINKLKEDLQFEKKEHQEKEQSLGKKDEALTKVRSEIKKLKDAKVKLQKKLSAMKIKQKIKECSRVNKEDKTIIHLEEENKDLKAKLYELEQLNDCLDDEWITTFENGKYTNEIRETIMTLVLENNVSLSKVNNVIETVLTNLCSKKVLNLPSNSLISRMITEARYIALKQVTDELRKSHNNCLHSDGTTKFHKHYESYQITTEEGRTLSLGLDNVASGTTESLLQSFEFYMKELSITLTDSKADDLKVANLISCIKHTMSDQGATNPSFNKQLEQLRLECLEKVTENWENLSTEIKDSMSEMGHHFCKMHLIVNFATEAENALKIFEQAAIQNGKNPHSFNSNDSCGAVRLIRTACKALTLHGSDKAGIGGQWQCFLSNKDLINKLVTFRGNRFNIVFYDALALYYHINDVKDFLESIPDLNRLLQSVLYDSKQKVYIAGIRALAIIDKLITGPLWRQIEATSSISNMKGPIKTLYNQLEKFASNAAPLE